MSKSIIVTAWNTSEGHLIEQEWTYKKIFNVWNEDSKELIPQLARRCQDYEERLEKIAVEWGKYKRFLQTKYPSKNADPKWEWTCPHHQAIAKILEKEL